jgi:hypothetical protein
MDSMRAQPKILEDRLFSRLSWDEESQWWEGIVLAGQAEAYTISVQPRSADDRTISEEACRIYAEVGRDLEGVRRRALQDFINQTRKYPFYHALTFERLDVVMRPGHILVRSDGYLEVGFIDPEGIIFGGGHLIVSRFWPSGTREVGLDG